MVLASVLCGVVLIWVFLYLLAYVVFLSPDYPDTKTDTSTVSTNFANSGANIDSTTSKLLTQLEQHLQQEQRSVTTIAQKYTNFFLSQSCKTGIDEITTEIDRKYAKAVTVIIAARNERRAALVATV